MTYQELYEALVDLSLFPVVPGKLLKVLVVDDDPKAVELVAVRMAGIAGTILRCYGGKDAIVLDLMMPDVNGFDVVAALHEDASTSRIPIIIMTAKHITPHDRAKLNGYVTTIMEKAKFDAGRFTDEVRRAMSGRHAGAV